MRERYAKANKPLRSCRVCFGRKVKCDAVWPLIPGYDAPVLESPASPEEVRATMADAGLLSVRIESVEARVSSLDEKITRVLAALERRV